MERLKQLRKAKGVTQDSVASILGITRAAYTNIENGKRQPAFDTMETLADYFGVSVDYLLGRAELTENKINPIPEDEVDSEILERFANLTPAQQEKVAAFIEGLLAAKE